MADMHAFVDIQYRCVLAGEDLRPDPAAFLDEMVFGGNSVTLLSLSGLQLCHEKDLR